MRNEISCIGRAISPTSIFLHIVLCPLCYHVAACHAYIYIHSTDQPIRYLLILASPRFDCLKYIYRSSMFHCSILFDSSHVQALYQFDFTKYTQLGLEQALLLHDTESSRKRYFEIPLPVLIQYLLHVNHDSVLLIRQWWVLIQSNSRLNSKRVDVSSPFLPAPLSNSTYTQPVVYCVLSTDFGTVSF